MEDSINFIKATDLDPRNCVGEQEVEVIKLDDFCKTNAITEIDILKIDVEGFEMEVLLGALEVLKKTNFIFIEVGFERMETKVHFSDLDYFMEKNNFQMCGLYDVTRQWRNKKKMWFANFLYINNNIY